MRDSKSRFVTVSTPGGDTFRYDLTKPTVRIGRSTQNDLVLKDATVTRREHARIEQRPDGDYVVHVAGSNPTVLNRQTITAPTRLRTGDAIKVGASELTYNRFPSRSLEFSDRSRSQIGETIITSDEIRLMTPISGESLTPMPASPALSVILEANRELVAHRPLKEMFATIMDLAHRIVPFERGSLLTFTGDRLEPQFVRTPAGERARGVSVSRAITDHVLREKEAMLVDDARTDTELRGRGSIAEEEVRASMCVPLMNEDEVIGVLYVDSRRETGLFSKSHLRMLTHLANVAAVKIENKRLFDRVLETEMVMEELRKAAQIQSQLFPTRPPQIDGYQVHGTSRPCYMVGGDYYDWIELPGGRWAFVLGDVAGKGFSAALLMSSFQASVHALLELDLEPGETVNRLNHIASRRLPSNRFITYFHGVLDVASHTITYVNAAQNRPAMVPADGATERLDATGTPLGVVPGMDYVARTLSLGVGDVLFCYSDGATDERNPADREFGDDRMLAVVEGIRPGSPQAIAEAVHHAIEAFQEDVPPMDDVTLLVIKRVG